MSSAYASAKDRPAGIAQPAAPWRVAGVDAHSGWSLAVRFLDGTEGRVEMKALVLSDQAGVFSVLRDESLFRQVAIEFGAVTWPGEIDLAPDAMYDAILRDGVWKPV